MGLIPSLDRGRRFVQCFHALRSVSGNGIIFMPNQTSLQRKALKLQRICKNCGRLILPPFFSRAKGVLFSRCLTCRAKRLAKIHAKNYNPYRN